MLLAVLSTIGDVQAASRGFVSPRASGVHLCHVRPYHHDVLPVASPVDPQGRQVDSCRDDTSAESIGRLIRDLNAQAPARGTTCPNNDGEFVKIEFRYPGGHRERVDVEYSGCRWAHARAARRDTTQQVRDDILRRSGAPSCPYPKMGGLWPRNLEPCNALPWPLPTPPAGPRSAGGAD